MKKIYTVILSLLGFSTLSQAQWVISTAGATADTVTFDATFTGVNNGAFNGSGLSSSPASGQLNSNAWMITGMSDSSLVFGSNVSGGDYARGASAGAVSSGGLYSFEVATGDSALGFQPGGSDMTPGDVILAVVNGTGNTIDSVAFAYDLYIYNDQTRGNSVNPSYAINSSSYTALSALNDTSDAAAQTTPAWVVSNKNIVFAASLASNDTLYIKWELDDQTGSNSRDEFALDNIAVSFSTASSNPSTPATPFYPIADINNVDANGVADSNSVTCWTQGVVLGVNMNTSGLSFTIWDGEGIGVYNNSGSVNGYTVAEGDSVMVKGTVNQYNGLTQLAPDSIVLINSSNTIPTPTVVTTLDESTESELVRFESAEITAISGANYTLVSGTDTITMRVSSATNIGSNLNFAIGDSLCYVIGIGSQFDNSTPYTSGYQLFPRTFLDVDTTCGSSSNPSNPSSTPFYPIADINNVDANGVADSNNVTCWTQGVVLGVNMNSGGLSFTIWHNEGIGVYGSVVNGYSVNEGDSVRVMGTVNQFNGLTQIDPDSIVLINSGNTIPTPTVVTALDESTESNLVTFEFSEITAVSGSNFTLVSGTDTITMRVDSDTDVLDSLTLAVGDSLCSVTGIGGQFDNSSPYTSGYQLFPRYYTDLDTTCGTVDTTTPPAVVIPTYDIEVLRTVNADFEPDSLGVYCAVEGIVYGVDLDGNNGISFTVIDETGGINIYNGNDVDNYVVTEGDEIRVVGEVDFYNGLTEFVPDSITILSTNNCIPFPTIVETLDESTESNYIEIRNVTIAPGQFWPAPTDNANIDIVTPNGDTLIMRIDKDTYLPDSILSAPSGTFTIVGIGGQFDGSAPYDEGYQIFPMFPTDFDTVAHPAPAGLVINELMASNDSDTTDESGQHEDWFELYNGGSTDLVLAGYFVTDDASDVIKYRIPRCNNETGLTAGDWKLLWADSDDEDGPLHTNFGLSGSGEFLGLYTQDGTVVDSISFGEATADVSFGRRQDGAAEWVEFEVTTPAASNNNGVVLSVSDVNNKPAFVAYPNPVSGSEIYFNYTVDVTVYNTVGQLVESAKQVNSLNVDNYKNGVYFIRTNEGEVVRMVVR